MSGNRSSPYGGVAHRIMKKQGWKEGDGLGAKSQGMSTPLKPLLKFDNHGVGHDPSKEFTDHWWADAFNAAASRITVHQDEQGEVAVRSREKRKKKEQKSGAYGRFVKTATLRSGRLEQEEAKDEEQDEKLPKRARLTDEELFKACGGLTAHKGARHGHRMTAKQARSEAMERRLLRKMKKTEKARRKKVDTNEEPKKKPK